MFKFSIEYLVSCAGCIYRGESEVQAKNAEDAVKKLKKKYPSIVSIESVKQ